MLHTKLVIRVLDAENQLLGWVEAVGVAKGDGCIRIEHNTPVLMDETGTPTQLSLHWADVNIEVRTPLTLGPMTRGETLLLNWAQPAIVCGPAAGGLPPVTVKTPIRVDLEPATLSGKG